MILVVEDQPKQQEHQLDTVVPASRPIPTKSREKTNERDELGMDCVRVVLVRPDVSEGPTLCTIIPSLVYENRQQYQAENVAYQHVHKPLEQKLCALLLEWQVFNDLEHPATEDDFRRKPSDETSYPSRDRTGGIRFEGTTDGKEWNGQEVGIVFPKEIPVVEQEQEEGAQEQ
ncbi:MAG: hypothetical protein MMC23_007900 [Stictis urceolatum]|nr:hypothetical protein [Stictis urceolata]